jgi:tetraacyldisaccharide 4'-kinase
MYFSSSIVRLRHLGTGKIYDAAQFRGWNVAVMCGVGNPHAFADDLLHAGINIVGENFFRDHHSFTAADIERVMTESREAHADAIVTSEKDAVRLEGLQTGDTGDIPMYAAILELQSEDEVRLKSLLLRTVTQR